MLLDALKRRASEEILFPLGEVGRRSVGEVLGFVSAWREAHEDWRGRAVSVGKMSSADLALFLFCLDGWASALRLELGDSDDPGLALMRSEADGDVAHGDVTTQWWLPTSATTRREPRWIAHDLESLSRSLQRDGLQGAGLV
jgi:hypothetical protein